MWMHLVQAAEVMRAGGVIGYPTEAVFGLGCDPLNAEAVQRLLAIKRRPVGKGLILLAADLDQLQPYVRLTEAQQSALRQHWPLATTYLIAASALTPAWIRGDHDKVAVRVTQHPLARALAQHFTSPLVSTSANRSTAPACRNSLQLQRQLGAELDFIVSGQCDLAAQPSTIIDLESGAVLRA